MFIGILMGLVVRLATSLIGGQRLDGLIMVMLILGDHSPTFNVGFMVAFFGFRILSIPCEVFQPINVESDVVKGSLIKEFIRLGQGPLLVRQMAFTEVVWTNLALIGGLITLPTVWEIGAKAEFMKYSIGWSPFMILLVTVGTAIKCGSAWWKYLVGTAIVTGFGAWVIGLGYGNFSMIIVLTLMFMGVEGLNSKRIPEQHWGDEYNWGSFVPDRFIPLCGMIASFCIGVPTASLVELFHDDEDNRLNYKMINHMAASSISSGLGIFMFMAFGSSRTAFGQVMTDLSIDLSGNFDLCVGMAFAIMVCSFVSCMVLCDWTKCYHSFIKSVVSIKISNYLVLVISVIGLTAIGIKLGLLIPMTILVVCGRHLMNEFDIPKESTLSMLAWIPLLGIMGWL